MHYIRKFITMSKSMSNYLKVRHDVKIYGKYTMVSKYFSRRQKVWKVYYDIKKFVVRSKSLS